MFCLLLVTNSHQSTLLQLGQEDLRVTCQEQPGVADVETDQARAELVWVVVRKNSAIWNFVFNECAIPYCVGS